ncbi:hypothetical protein RHGRI_035062 [Rhododendron griersonianum]|uniref:DUF4408 domain-containing protein n=1 Tax=Rhododendron griersonianum TaxID=479676 RepID=A0AAV6I353_9ERIC|nr:hypothetical protein RHGRI_035062 [Rhododendron griersonianum]
MRGSWGRWVVAFNRGWVQREGIRLRAGKGNGIWVELGRSAMYCATAATLADLDVVGLIKYGCRDNYGKQQVLLVLPNPQIASVLFSSKFLFIVGNLIFIILIGESKIKTSYTTSTSNVCSKSLDKKEEENLEMFFEERIITSCEGGEGQLQEWIKEKQDAEEELDGEGKLEELIEEKQDAEEKKLEERIEENQDAEEELDSEDKLEEWKEEKRDAEEELDGEGLGSPVEKLNKRVDDFIARVQKRRSLELLAYTCEERERGFGEPHTKRE